jgi:hypothetical protein
LGSFATVLSLWQAGHVRSADEGGSYPAATQQERTSETATIDHPSTKLTHRQRVQDRERILVRREAMIRADGWPCVDEARRLACALPAQI